MGGGFRRRDLLKAMGAGAAAVAAPRAARTVRGQSRQSGNGSDDRPNVLFIMTDQHRADYMTCAGNDTVPTPNIDRVAERGVRFENAYCPYPVSLASRSALLTSLYAHTTGAINNDGLLDWRYRSVADHFADNGYLTGLVGKMHFNDAHNHGFHYYLSINDWLVYLGPRVQTYANEIANHPLNKNYFFNRVKDIGAGFPDVDVWHEGSPWEGTVERRDFDTVASRMDAEHHLDMFLARESVRFLERYREQPFFLVTSFMKPHTPFFPPREWAEKYRIEDMRLPEIGDISGYPRHIQARIRRHMQISERRRRAAMAGYLGNLAFVDHCVGKVLDGLEELGLAENTIVVYTSDHGEMQGDHGLFQKFCLFDPAVKVPLMVAHPGSIPRGRVTDALTEYMGLYPTLSDLAGLPRPTARPLVPFEGAPDRLGAASFAELARNPDAKGPEAVFSEYALRSRNPRYMVRTRRWKYIYNQGGSCHELYDLKNDPGEFENRLHDSECRDIASDLRDRLFAWYDPASNPYTPLNQPEKASSGG